MVGESMKAGSPLGFFFSVGVVGFMILCVLGQLMGSIWFHKATGMGHEEDSIVGAMGDALKFQPSHSFYWFVIGRKLQDLSEGSAPTLMKRRHLLEEAEKYLERAISLEPTASLYHYHLGWVCAALSPYRPSLKWKAHIAFCRAISLNPTNTEFRWAVGHYYLRQYAHFLKLARGAHPETDIGWARSNFQRHFRAFLQMQPAHELNRLLDRCFAVTQEYDDLKGLIPDQPLYHLRLAQFLSQKGMWGSAREEFEIAISQDPTDPEPYRAYGSALFAHRHYEEALAIWKKEQAISPQNPQSYLALSNALWTLERKEEALAELEQLVSIHPEELSYRLLLARRLETVGKPKGALKAYQQALEVNSKEPRVYYAIGLFWTRQKDFAEAELSLQRAISLDPSNIGFRNQLAQLYYRQKRYVRAIEEWRYALDQNPKFIGALKGIAQSYEKLEAWGGALRYYGRAFALRPDDRSLLQRIERIKENHSAAGSSRFHPPTSNPTRFE